jgi:bacterioferritin
MQGDAQTIKHLNVVLKNELTSINQYFLHSRMFRNWGLKRLQEHEHQESLDEMRHADQLIERILFLEGLPNLQDLGKLLIGENVAEIIDCDLRLENAARADLRVALAHCEQAGDYVSRQLLTAILESEEEHIDWLETQQDLIGRIGLERYTQAQMLDLEEEDK